MTHTHPPPAMNLYRARPLEVRAIDCGDGRFVLLTDPPRYVEAAEFAAGFELVEEKRAGDRRTSNGHGRPKGKQERRKSPGRRKKNGDDENHSRVVDGVRAKARELWDGGKEPSAIAKAIGKNVANVYYWKKADKWPERKAAASAPEQSLTKRCRHCGQMTPANGKWCQHCMETP